MRFGFALLLLGAASLVLVRSAHAEAAQPKVVVFVPPAEIEASLRDALTAQLSGIDVELVVEHFVSEKKTLRAAVEESRSLAAAHQAIGVFWIDTRPKDEWLLFLMEPVSHRVLMRRIPIGPEGAAVEAVSVITRESTSSLLAGQKIGMAEVVVPEEPLIPPTVPEPPPKPPPPPPRPRPFRPISGLSLGASYYGDLFANDTGWQSGVGLSAAWNFRSGLRLGGSFVAFGPITTEQDGFALLIGRLPFSAEVGYSHAVGRILLTLSLRGIVEVVSRHVISAPPPAHPTPDATRTVVFLSPRPRLDYRVTEALSIFLAVGLDFAPKGFSFVNRVDGKDEVLFEPRSFRPAGELGVTFWP